MITQEELKRHLHYDEITGIFTRIISISKRVKVGDIAGTKTCNGYIAIRINWKSYRAHRLAWLYVNGKFPKYQIDHINNVRDDNRIINLRESTNQQNCHNRKFNTNGKTLPLGVSIMGKKYQAQIRLDGKLIYLGLFITKESAYIAYLTKKRLIHSTCTI